MRVQEKLCFMHGDLGRGLAKSFNPGNIVVYLIVNLVAFLETF